MRKLIISLTAAGATAAPAIARPIPAQAPPHLAAI